MTHANHSSHAKILWIHTTHATFAEILTHAILIWHAPKFYRPTSPTTATQKLQPTPRFLTHAKNFWNLRHPRHTWIHALTLHTTCTLFSRLDVLQRHCQILSSILICLTYGQDVIILFLKTYDDSFAKLWNHFQISLCFWSEWKKSIVPMYQEDDT